MARVPQSEIDRLKSEVSLERLVQSRGIELKPHGKDLIGHCPFHADKTPSLVITTAKNLWHCLGACQIGGSVIDWVMKMEGVSFRHAVELLRTGETPTGPARPTKVATVPKLACPVELDVEDHKLLGQVVTYYTSSLKESPEALAYLKTRGLTDPELIDRFRLGFANRTLGLRLPDKNRKAGSEIRNRLQALGILRETGHEHFNGSLVIPILDQDGRVQGIYGRKITPNLKAGIPLHLYLPGPHRGVFNVRAVAAYPEVILCEALIDALTFLDAGFPNAISSYGVSGFTSDHLEALRRHRTQRVLIAYDRDDAGDKGAQIVAEQLMAEGIECFRIQFPRGMDANGYALSTKPPHKALEVLIRSAVWMGKGKAPARPHFILCTEEEAKKGGQWIDSDEPTAAAPAPSRAVVVNGSGPIEMGDESQVPLDLLFSAPPPASPVPPAPMKEPELVREGTDVKLVRGDRLYRVRGLEKNQSPEMLKVNVMVTKGDAFHVDVINLYLAPQRDRFIRDAMRQVDTSEEVLRKDLGHLLRGLEAMQQEQMKEALAPKKSEVVLTDEERSEALELLKDPRLLDRILEDFVTCGVVGEETNKLVGYLGAVSRKLEAPLAVVIQSSSAAGKSSLMESILAFVPDEDRVKYSAMTGQSLFYMGEADLKHKVLAIVEEEGAERASYALKLLQSEGELTIASTGKDPTSGRHITHEYRVEGPVMIFLTTTAVEIDEELLNRCLVLSVDENRDQTRDIHRIQRERQTLEGFLSMRDVSHIFRRQRNAQRLLRPLLVANPYAPRLTFRDDQIRMRRDHGKYLTMIRVIALLHQHQRPLQTAVHRGKAFEYIEVTLDDIRHANRLAHDVLGRTLDELPPQTRRLLHQVDAWVTSQCEKLAMLRSDFHFSRRDIRQLTGWSESYLRSHLEKLERLEYLIPHRGTRGQSFLYELLYDGQGKDGEPFLIGLLDPEELEKAHGYDGKFAVSGGEFAQGSRSLRTGFAVGSRNDGGSAKTASDGAFRGDLAESAGNTVLDTPPPVVPGSASYPQEGREPRRHNGTRRMP